MIPMPPDPINNCEPVILSPQRLARRLLTIGENRIALLMVEVQEERERLLRATLLALSVAVFGFLAAAALTVALVVALWSFSPLAVLLMLGALYCTASLLLYRRFTFLQRNWETLPATLDQLKKDRACLESHLL